LKSKGVVINKNTGKKNYCGNSIGWRAIAVFLAKCTFAAIVLWILFRFEYIQVDLIVQLGQKLYLFPVLVVLLGMAFPICALRWHFLLKTQGIHFRYAQIFKVNYISTFFGLFLPGAIGGDAIRIALGSTLLPKQKLVLALSAFVDRIIGALGLFSWVVVAIFFFLTMNKDVYETQALFLGIGSVVAVSILSVLSAKYLSVQFQSITRNHDWQNGNILQRIFAKSADSIVLYRNCPVQLAVCYLLSLLVHASRLAVIYILAVSMGMGGGDVLTYVLAGSVSFFVNFIPVTPGGIGLSEAVFTQIVGILESSSRQMAYGTVILVIRAFDAAILLPAILMRYDNLRSRLFKSHE
jgi:uncharacterized protein (TIRG00374 family)